jgi:hypothetical protein
VTPSSHRSCSTSGIKLRALAVPLRDLDTVGPAKTEDERRHSASRHRLTKTKVLGDLGMIKKAGVGVLDAISKLRGKLTTSYAIMEVTGYRAGAKKQRLPFPKTKRVAEFQDVDKRSFAFRYPVTRKGEASLERGFRFKLFRFADVLNGLFPTLIGAAIGTRDEYEDTIQAMGEAQEEIERHIKERSPMPLWHWRSAAQGSVSCQMARYAATDRQIGSARALSGVRHRSQGVARISEAIYPGHAQISCARSDLDA